MATRQYTYDTITQMEAITGMTNGQSVIVKDLKRGGTFVYDSSLLGTNDNGIIIDGWVRQYDGMANPLWFGAIGDGTIDDTSALEDMFDNTQCRNFDLLGLTYKTSTMITLSGSVYNINGNGGTFKHDGTTLVVRPMLTFTNNSATIKIVDFELDGSDTAEAGIYVVGSHTFDNVHIHNFEKPDSGTEWACSAIEVNFTTSSTIHRDSIIKNSRFHDMNGITDNFITNAQGSSRVVDYRTDENSVGSRMEFSNNLCYDVYGEEGDCLSIRGSETTFSVAEASYIIFNNHFSKFNRRGVKGTADNLEIRDNYFETYPYGHARAINGTGLITVFENNGQTDQMTNIIIENNTCFNNSALTGISVYDSDGGLVNGNYIKTDPNQAASGITVASGSKNFTVSNNVAYATSSFISFDKSTNTPDEGVIENNTFYPMEQARGFVTFGDTTDPASTYTGLLFNNNTVMGLADLIDTTNHYGFAMFSNQNVTLVDIMFTNNRIVSPTEISRGWMGWFFESHSFTRVIFANNFSQGSDEANMFYVSGSGSKVGVTLIQNYSSDGTLRT